MFLWIRDQRWLPTIFLAATCFLILGGSDLIIQGETALIAASVLSLSVAFSRALPYVSIGLYSVGTFIPLSLGLEPQLSQLAITVSLLILACYADALPRRIGYALNIILDNCILRYRYCTSRPGDSLRGSVAK